MSVACLPLCMIIILAVKEFQQRNCPYKRRSIGQYQKFFFSSLFLKQKTTTKRNFKATGHTRGCLKEACCTLHTAHYTVTNNTLINYPAHVLFLAAAGCRLRNSRGVDSVDCEPVAACLRGMESSEPRPPATTRYQSQPTLRHTDCRG